MPGWQFCLVFLSESFLSILFSILINLISMAKKKKVGKHIHPKNSTPAATSSPKWHLPFILGLTAIIYLPTLNAGFVNWDDPDYIYNNSIIKDLGNITAFFTVPIQGNYHPLTMISLALNYTLSGYDAWSYHLFNLLFHLINCILVYKFALLLSRHNNLIAFVTSLFFAVHPMHVESVAWVAERKDVLYTLFFLAGHITFTKFIDSGSKKNYWMTLVFLVLSLLSKPAAVIFPVSLFCIDILRSRTLSFKLILEKIPFFIPAILMGLLTIKGQKEIGATGEEYFGLATNILFGFYGIMMYFFKLILPVGQSAFYPFPPLNEKLSILYYAAPLFTLLLALIVYYSRKKHKAVVFGISFYIINLLLVLQVFSVGSAVIAERYTYVPYIGVFYIIGYLINIFVQKNTRQRYHIALPVGFIFSYLAFLQVQNWKDGAALWDNVIKNQPCSRAYNSRANLLREEKQYAKAIEYLTRAIQLNRVDHESYNNRANVYMDLKKFDSAYIDYRNALAIKGDYYVTYDNLGAMFAQQNMLDSSLHYLNKALQLNPDYKPAYNNRAVCYINMQRFDDAIKDWEVLLRFDPDNSDILNSIGLCYRMLGKNNDALNYIDRALNISIKGPFLLNRSFTYFNLKNFEMARRDALEAKRNGVQLDPAYSSSLGIQ
jgi:tetratricopeptide (TPR) repeat protein